MRQRRTIEKPKMSSSEKTALTLSIIAIVFSFIQLVFSIPFLANRFYAPEIIGELEKKEFRNGEINFQYVIKNQGNKTAENIAISLTCFKNDKVTVAPNLNFLVEEKEDGEPLKDIIIKSEAFVPGDYLFVLISTDSATYQKRDLVPFIPFLGQIRYKDGFGIIKHPSNVSQ